MIKIIDKREVLRELHLSSTPKLTIMTCIARRFGCVNKEKKIGSVALNIRVINACKQHIMRTFLMKQDFSLK